MSRLGQRVGSLFDAVMAWLERRSPAAALELKRHVHRPDMELALRLLARRGFNPAVAIDAGAYRGEWARLCRTVFPSCRVLMIEPSPERARALEKLCQRDLQLRVERALLGSRDQEVFFREDGANSLVVPAATPGAVAMASSPLDMLVPGSPFAAPELLHISVEGYGLEVLKGAEETLASVQVIVLELPVRPLAASAPSIRAAVDWLDDRGFRLVDICTFIRRPTDAALAGLDAMFARTDSKAVSARLGSA